MKQGITSAAMACCCSLLLVLTPQTNIRQTPLCVQAKEAITDADSIRAGLPRREVEKRFRSKLKSALSLLRRIAAICSRRTTR
jgi:hypothetical protein